MSPDNQKRIERAVELFHKGYNCSQSVVAAFADRYGLSEELALRLASPFGAGIGRMRETCGAACGMFLLAGLEEGNTTPDVAAKGATYEVVQMMAAEFRARNGSLNCGELLGLRPRTQTPESAPAADSGQRVCSAPATNPATATSPTPEERTQTNYKKRPCAKMVEEAATIFAEYLERKAGK